jgi:UDPglucose 6-dehydrogenase
MDVVGADKRIGRAFLNAGRGYGGGCFPKDVSGLIRSAEDYGVAMEVMTAAAEVNSSMPHYIIGRAEEVYGSLAGKQIAVLGLAFKAGTSDARRSPGVIIANTLDAKQAMVRVYDPAALEEAAADLRPGVAAFDSLQEAVKNADIIFIATDWSEFIQAGIDGLAKLSGAKVIIDAMNCLDNSAVPDGITYIGVGR